MAGLLDLFGGGTGDPQKDAAINQGLLQMGLQMMQSRGSLGQALGQGGMAGIQGYNQANDQQFQQKQRQQQQMQWDAQNREAARKKQMEDLAPKFYQTATQNALAGGGGPTLANAEALKTAKPSFNWDGYIGAVEGIDPMQAMQLRAATAKDNSPLSVPEGTTLLDRKTYKPLFENPKSDSTPSAIKEYNFAKGQGYAGTFEQFQLASKRAGAANTSIKIDNKFGEGVAKEVGPMLKSSYDSALGAQASVGTADSLIKAIDSGKVISGPGATMRLRGAQFSQMLGIGGKGTEEQIANTRAAIQGLAQTTLTARKSLAGQGQVSDNEGKLLERAASGNIDDMTAAEIKQIAVVNKRLAQRQVSMHNEFVKKIKANPTTSELSTMFELPTSGDSFGDSTDLGGGFRLK